MDTLATAHRHAPSPFLSRRPAPPVRPLTTGPEPSWRGLFLVGPPYERERPITSLPDAHLPPGTVVLVELVPLPRDWDRLTRELALLRRRHLGASLVLRVAADLEELLELTTRGAPPSVQGVVLRGQPLRTGLRRQLTNGANLPAAVVEWLGLRGIRMSPALAEFVRQIFARAHAHAEISSLCREVGAVESSGRFRFSKKGLPPPSRWLQAARALHAVLRLQADPRTSLLSHALALGYSDHSALSHQVRRTFGLRPGELRDILGWEWLMERWLERARPRARKGDLGAKRESCPTS